MIQVEAPLLTPRPLINPNYTGDNIFMPATLAFNDVPIFDNLADPIRSGPEGTGDRA
jgi:hypothetical protein